MKPQQSPLHDGENPSKVAKLSNNIVVNQFHQQSPIALVFGDEILTNLIVDFVLTVTIEAGQMEAMCLDKQDYTTLGILLQVNKFLYQHPYLNECYWKAKIHSHFPGMALSNNPIENIRDPFIKEGLTQMKAAQYKALIDELQFALKKEGLKEIDASQLTAHNETAKGKAQLIEKISEKIYASDSIGHDDATKAQLIEAFSEKIDASQYMGRDKSYFDYFKYLTEQFLKREFAGMSSVASVHLRLLSADFAPYTALTSQASHENAELCPDSSDKWYANLIQEHAIIDHAKYTLQKELFFSNLITHESQCIRVEVHNLIKDRAGKLCKFVNSSNSNEDSLWANFYREPYRGDSNEAPLNLALDDKGEYFIFLGARAHLESSASQSRDCLDTVTYQADLFYEKYFRIPLTTVVDKLGPLENLDFLVSPKVNEKKIQYKIESTNEGYLALMKIINDKYIIPLNKIFLAFSAIMLKLSPDSIVTHLENQKNLESVLRDYTTTFHSKTLKSIEKCHTLSLIEECNVYLSELPNYENLMKSYDPEAPSLTETFKLFYKAELMDWAGYPPDIDEKAASKFLNKYYPNLFDQFEDDEEDAKIANKVNELKTFIVRMYRFLLQGPKLAEVAAPIQPITFNLLTYIALFYPQLLDHEKFAALLTEQSVDVEKVKQEINAIQANLSKIALLIPITKHESRLSFSEEEFKNFPFSLQYNPMQNLNSQKILQNIFLALDPACLSYTCQRIYESETSHRASFSQVLTKRLKSVAKIPSKNNDVITYIFNDIEDGDAHRYDNSFPSIRIKFNDEKLSLYRLQYYSAASFFWILSSEGENPIKVSSPFYKKDLEDRFFPLTVDVDSTKQRDENRGLVFFLSMIFAFRNKDGFPSPLRKLTFENIRQWTQLFFEPNSFNALYGELLGLLMSISTSTERDEIPKDFTEDAILKTYLAIINAYQWDPAQYPFLELTLYIEMFEFSEVPDFENANAIPLITIPRVDYQRPSSTGGPIPNGQLASQPHSLPLLPHRYLNKVFNILHKTPEEKLEYIRKNGGVVKFLDIFFQERDELIPGLILLDELLGINCLVTEILSHMQYFTKRVFVFEDLDATSDSSSICRVSMDQFFAGIEAKRPIVARLSLHLLLVDQTKVSPEELENVLLFLTRYAISDGLNMVVLEPYVNCFNEYEKSISEALISPFIILFSTLLSDDIFNHFLLSLNPGRNNTSMPVFFREIFESLIKRSFMKAHSFWAYIVRFHLPNWAAANNPQNVIAEVHEAMLILQKRSEKVVAPSFSSHQFCAEVANEFIPYCPDKKMQLSNKLLGLSHLGDETKVLKKFSSDKIVDITKEALQCANHNYDFLENALNRLFNSDCMENPIYRIMVADSLLQAFLSVFPETKQWQYEETILYQTLVAYYDDAKLKMPTYSLNKPPQPPAVIAHEDKELAPQSLQQNNPVDLGSPVQQATHKVCQGSHIGFFNSGLNEEDQLNSSYANHNQPELSWQMDFS